MKLNPKYLFCAALLGIPCSLSNACLWDTDTLAMERSKFPGAFELVAGYFVRHSPVYYKWRIRDRETNGEGMTPGDYDDVAVSHDKLGNHGKAIHSIRIKMEKWPGEGQYESQANLGTFLIHNGQFEEGLVHIKKAIELNPEAHFGREIYQQHLVEYLISKGYPETPLPLGGEGGEIGNGIGFHEYLVETVGGDSVAGAANGVMGMMRFGTYNSPVLLEVLGDLMMTDQYPHTDSSMIAARAYLHASYVAPTEGAKEAYRKKASAALVMHELITLQDVEKGLQSELKSGKEVFADISSDEKAWFRAGLDLDAMFAEKYYDVGLPSLQATQTPKLVHQIMGWLDVVVFIFLVFLFIAGYPIVILHSRSKKKAN